MLQSSIFYRVPQLIASKEDQSQELVKMAAKADSDRAKINSMEDQCLRQASSKVRSTNDLSDLNRTVSKALVSDNLTPQGQVFQRNTLTRPTLTTKTSKRWRTRTTSHSRKVKRSVTLFISWCRQDLQRRSSAHRNLKISFRTRSSSIDLSELLQPHSLSMAI